MLYYCVYHLQSEPQYIVKEANMTAQTMNHPNPGEPDPIHIHLSNNCSIGFVGVSIMLYIHGWLTL